MLPGAPSWPCAFRDEPSLAAGRVSGHHRIPVIHALTDPVTARDRQRAIRLGEYGQHVRPQHLREAPVPATLVGLSASVDRLGDEGAGMPTADLRAPGARAGRRALLLLSPDRRQIATDSRAFDSIGPGFSHDAPPWTVRCRLSISSTASRKDMVGG